MIDFDSNFDFNDIFVLDLANNHQGMTDHGLKIIDACADAADSNNVRAGIKFQFRDLPRFVHADEQKNPTNKHVPRFLSTILPWDEYRVLLKKIQDRGMLSICTPFDESSVKHIVDMGFDIIKVASCSAKDWPLLDAIADSGLPVIASTGGLLQEEVDGLVSFLRHKGCNFSIMHCVAIYPTPDENCNLANIKEFCARYPDITIGWSTHEDPDDSIFVGLAMASGAKMFERHVGMEAQDIELNKYSSSPDQVNKWMKAAVRAKTILGSEKRLPSVKIEAESIDGLKRGVFARNTIEPDHEIKREDVYFAFPYREGQLSSGEWKDGIIANQKVEVDQPLIPETLIIENDSNERIIKHAIHEAKAMLAHAKVPLSHEFTTEYSHHYGITKFREVGVVLISVLNREYAKKILVQLPGQKHPMHYHKLKEETFIVLSGELISNLDGVEKILKPGDSLTVPPGVWHKFKTETGCVFEEISTTAFSNDSVYRDPSINELTSGQRKTVVDHWGRFQIKEQLI
jgi:sialic acid synthase SpsE/quercetin dioxygenase-like cupin family protein